MTVHLLDLSPPELRARLRDSLTKQDQPNFRERQIHSLLFDRRLADPQKMGNIPAAIREHLGRTLLRPLLEDDGVEVSRDETRKFRWRVDRGGRIESVWIPSGRRGTLCLSSQAGCPAACTFCATGAAGFNRNLTPGEIVSQWLRVLEAVRPFPPGIVSQIVFMGMGEPLLNYRSVKTALELFSSTEGFGISPRRITVSTVGIAPRIPELIRDFPQVRLALSLHSARDETREKIVPLNRKYPVATLLGTLRSLRSSARRVSLEYVHLAGINDTESEARALGRFAAATESHINILPFHPFPGAPYEASRRKDVEQFRQRVRNHYTGRITIRRSRGLDISGACGQLAGTVLLKDDDAGEKATHQG